MASTAGTASGNVFAHRLGMIRLTASGAIAGALVFFFCWVGTFIPFSSPTHAYISLFTNAPVGSARALWEGFCWSFLFGGFVAATFAVIYNSLSALEPR